MSDPLLAINGVCKSFFGVSVLRHVSFTLGRGGVCGIVGENGAGKSTLMNILGGVVNADAGTLLLDGEEYVPRKPADAAARGIAFIHQELNLFPNLSVGENLCLQAMPRRGRLPFIDRRAVRERARALLAAVDLRVDPNASAGDLSPGQRQLLEIAKALGSDVRLVIFDEPTTSLTAHEIERLFALIGQLRARGIAIIYISHTLEHVLKLCDQVVVLRDGEVVGASPREQFTLPRLISLMVGRTIEQLYPVRGSTQHPAVSGQPATEPVLEACRLSQPGIVANISFELHRGEVLGMAGLMGSGRSELARILFGLDPCERGEIRVEGSPLGSARPRDCIRRGVAFLTENRREEGLMMEASIADNIALVCLPAFSRGRVIAPGRLRQAVRQIAGAVRLQCGSDRQAVKTLSGGNQQKVVLAKWLLQRPAVLILDEPTRGIDIGARQEIYALINDLAAGGTGVLLISSEIEELIGLCDRIMVMSRGEITGRVERKNFDRERILELALEGHR